MMLNVRDGNFIKQTVGPLLKGPPFYYGFSKILHYVYSIVSQSAMMWTAIERGCVYI
jgi:hypothetical protein